MSLFGDEHQRALLPAVQALLQAADAAELAKVLAAYPGLADPAADLVISQFMLPAVMEHDTSLVATIGRRLRLVRVARKDGVDAALADFRATITADQPPELHALWDAAVAAGHHGAADAAAAWAALLNHPGYGRADHDFRQLALDSAIGAQREAVRTASRHHDELSPRLTALARLYRDSFGQTRRPADLDSAIETYSAAVAAPPERASLPGLLSELGRGLRTRFEQSGEAADLDATIDAYRRASTIAPRGSALLPKVLNEAGLALIARNARGDRPADLDVAIENFRRAAQESEPGSAILGDSLSNLTGGYWTRYEQRGRIEDLKAAAGTGTRAVELTPDYAPSLAGRLGNLALIQWAHYKKTGRRDALDAVIDANRRLVKSMSADSHERAESLADLGTALRTRHGLTGDLADLDEAVASFRHALDVVAPGSPDIPKYLSNLGVALVRRYEMGNWAENLDEATELFRRVVAAGPGGPYGARSLGNLGGALCYKYENTGDPRYLEQAMQTLTEAASASAGAPGLPGALHNVGGILQRLYYRNGRLADLEQSIEIQERAVQLTPAGSPELAAYLGNLGSALLLHHERTRDPADLDAAIGYQQRAIETAADPLVQSAVLCDLGDSFVLRYPRSADARDLNAAIDSYTRAVEITPAHAPSQARHLFRLASGLTARFTYGNDIADLDSAVDVYRRAVGLAGKSAATRAHLLMSLGLALMSRHRAAGRPDDLEAAVRALREGCGLGVAAASRIVVNAAQMWGEWAASRQAWPEAAEAYQAALEAAGRLVELEIGRQQKESWLRAARELASPAAYAFARCGDLEAAVLILERWHAIMLSAALHLDQRVLDRLRAAHPDLYQRYRALAGAVQEAERQQLADLAMTGTAAAGTAEGGTARAGAAAGGAAAAGAGGPADLATARDDLARILAEIREQPGFGNFLLPPAFAEIAEIAGEVPLVYLSAAPDGGLALLVLPGGGVTPVWLPELTGSELASRAWAYFRGEGSAGWTGEIDSLTRWLWSAAMGPLLAAAGDATAMVLVPGGLLGLLPLHAAWTHDPSAVSGRRYALDQVRLTYAGNARVLAACRIVARGLEARSVLAVGDPLGLAHAARELDAVCARFPAAARLEGATQDEVIAALGDHPVLHFACHGAASPADPMASSLLVASGERLTMRQVLTRRLTAARLVVLSACETAIPGAEIPDEAVGMPSSFIEAGAGGAIGSLWEVPDVATMMLMTQFYELWRERGLEPAEALRRAQQWVRDSTNGAKLRRFPDVPELAADALPEWARADWEEGHDHASPLHWAAFTYVGA